MDLTEQDRAAVETISKLSQHIGIDVKAGRIRRTSSRFCFGVEHGDYNGTELFGVGTDRFIWMACRPSETKKVRLFSGNFPDDGIIEFDLGNVPEPGAQVIADTWGRFAFGVDYILRREGFKLARGIEGVIFADIPGGGMGRSASLTLNLILSLLEANGIEIEDKLRIAELAQAVENDYVGSPCGNLDQVMILFARAGMGLHYKPASGSVEYVPYGGDMEDFRIAILDTGTIREGLEKSTYKVRRAECERLVSILQEAGYKISCLADIREEALYEEIIRRFAKQYPDLCDRLKYIFGAQRRFYEMLDAWRAGDIETVGRIFRTDGLGLRDDYKISGPQLEVMCDIARTVPGVLGERMLGGGDKGASGTLVRTESVDALRNAVEQNYPSICPEYADKYAVHICRMVDGVRVYEGLL